MVRDQVQRALADGLTSLHTETQGAVQALQAVKRTVNARVALWTLGVAAAAAAIAFFIAWWVPPTPDYVQSGTNSSETW